MIAGVVSKLKHQLFHQPINISILTSDVLIASYPKSGRSWLSFLITLILNKDRREQMNLWDFEKEMFEFNSLEMTKSECARLNSLSNPRFFQTHLLPSQVPSFSKSIYLLRDPRDVLVSYWHYLKLTDETFHLSLKEFVLGKSHWPCQWHEHVSEWLLEPRRSAGLLVVKYEDLHQDTPETLKKILDFLGVSHDDEDIFCAAQLGTFDRMKAMEEDEWKLKGGGPSWNAEERFIRRGKIGGWRGELDLESQKFIEHRYRRAMKKTGYV